MDNLRMEHPGPLSKPGSAHHLLSFSPPSIGFSTQHNKPPHNSNSHHLQRQAPWPLHWAEQHYHQASPIHTPPAVKNRVENHDDGLCRTWDISDPILQLKHGSTSVSAGFPHQGARIDALRRDATHSSGVCVAASPLMEKGSSFPVSVVSGPGAIPFACKLDAPKGRDMGFASLSGYDRDAPERNSGRAKEAVAIVKAEVVGGSPASLKGSDGGGIQQLGSSSERRAVVVKEEQEGAVTIASLEDGSIGLKLGKRTYYEDAGGEEAIKRANNSNSSNGNNNTTTTTTTTTTTNNNTTTTSSNNGGVSKKHKGSSLNTTIPRCQAEGCKADLSGAKDYHRRHKVCEWHSKASKAKVANLEQRFCQQCSRFHVLSEFDEGKRSCRRRLAGHNERRRKPPPEPMSLLSPGSFAYFADGRANASLLDHPYFLQHRRAAMSSSLNNAALACQLGLAGLPQEEGLALELHHFMQGLPPGGGAGAGLLDGGRALMVVANGHGLALSNPPGPSLAASPPSSSRVGLIPDPQPSSEMAISGRALSLLSSSLGSPNNPCTMSMSLGMTSPSIDQLFAETHALASSRQIASGPSCFSPGMGIVPSLHDLRHNHNHNHGVNSLSSSSSGCSPDIEQGKPHTMPIFEGRSMFLMLPENGYQNLQTGGSSQHGRPMLDLMQISSTEAHHHHQQQQAEVPYTDLHGLSIFGRQSIM